jgi:hypothetical protein
LKVLDLFAGLRGWSDPFKARGHETFSVDFDKKFDVDLHMDITKMLPDALPWKPDIVLASPPCETFSMMSVGTHWTHDHQPKSDKARMTLGILDRTFALITMLDPHFFVIENPRAKLRKMPHMRFLQRRTVTYCQFGENRMKPTDLWGRFPPTFSPPPMCKNRMPCHVAAPRGSRTGTQGMDKAESAKIPAALSLAVCLAAEEALR